jgi:ribosomal protein S6--L-glutamate ligase
MMRKIAVIGVRGGWSSERLADALAAKTGFRCLLDAESLSCDLTTGRVTGGGVALTDLSAVIIKKVGLSYAAQHNARLELLRLAQEHGARMFSRPDRILAAYDRIRCTMTLRLGDIPMPPTVITEDIEAAHDAVKRFESAVLKPVYGSKARGMCVVRAGPATWDELHQFVQDGNPVLYIQKQIDLPGRDLGVVFLGGRYLATYARVREGESWSTTTEHGGRYEPVEPCAAVLQVADRAQQLFGLDFTCVDVAEGPDGPVVFEVSAFGGFRGLWQAHGFDAAKAYAEYILGKLDAT